MCGICGVIGLESTERSSLSLRRMLAAIIHRGPDEEGSRVAPGFAAGTRRLSVIDLAGGSQPIWNENETLAVFYNGEIYNFQELRHELMIAGHRFRTNSDTEVIVHAYEAWGSEGFSRLHGMFAFAIAEMPQGKSGPVTRVVLARDRYGIKPLYYSANGGALLFASEVRALLASGRVAAQLCSESVSSYLLFGSTVEPCTLIDGVYSLPPGHFAVVSTASAPLGLEPKPFWRPAFQDSHDQETRRRSEPPEARIRGLLEGAVRRHLIADVPAGVFLSSGLDSTAIAALASRAQSGIHTFTVSFPDLEFSEAELARQTAARLGTHHTELQLSSDSMVARLEEAIEAFDQPSMDGINTYFVSWAARQSGLKVALSGLGSDEIFGGYPTFRTTSSIARLESIARITPPALRSLVVSAARKISPARAVTPAFEKALGAWLRPDSLPHPYYFVRTLFPPQVTTAATASTSSWAQSSWWHWLRECAQETRTADNFTAVSWLELRGYMLNTLLRDTDAMSMANSLEVRVPFLDAALVDAVLALPEAAKRANHKPKSLLTAALGELLPPEIAAQTKKTFTFPWERWLRGSLGGRVEAGLADWSPALGSILGGQFALSVWEDFLQGRTTWSRPWSLYVLNQWAKRHLHSAEPSRPSGAGAIGRADILAEKSGTK